MRGAKLTLLAMLVPATAYAAWGIPSPSDLFSDLIGKATGGAVATQGVSGWPNALHFDRLELRDADGAWLIAEDVTLDWHPYLLARKRASIELLQAARVQVPRLQHAAPSTGDSANSSSSLPVEIEVKRLQAARVELGAPVLGQAAALSLQGSLALPSLETPTAHLELHRLDGGGDYKLDAEVTQARVDARLAVTEPEHGLIAQVAALPDIGKLDVQATVAGPRSAVATQAAVTAGPLSAKAEGTVDLVGEQLDLRVQASAPAMTPAPDVSWQAVALDAAVKGKWTTPDATGTLRLTALDAAGAAVRSLTAELSGNAGRVTVHAVADGVRVPGPAPDLLKAAPLTLDATATLDDPTRPVTFKLAHPLLAAEGQARTAGTQEVTATIGLPQLAPFAALGGVDIQGSTQMHLHAAMRDGGAALDGDGTLAITGGVAPLPGLIGDNATLGIAMAAKGQDLTISRFDLRGKTLSAQLTGGRTGAVLTGDLKAGLTDLAVVAPTLSGAVQATGHLEGPADSLTVAGHVDGEIGAPGVPRGPITVDAKLSGVPSAPSGRVEAQGRLAGAPLQLAVNANRASDGTVDATIDRADWRSLHAEGALRLPTGTTVPLGRVKLRMSRLDDLRPFVGQALSGSLEATLQSDPAEARLDAEAHDAGIPGSRAGRATVNVRVRDPLGTPVVTASARFGGIDAAGVTGSATVDVTGPQNALAIRTDAQLGLSGTPAQITGAATLDLPGKSVRVGTLQVAAKGETARLLGPATVRFGGPVAVDRLRVGLRQAVLDVSGQVSPRLDATATLRAPADLAAIASPSLALDGTIALDAKLSGTPAAPGGTVRLQATGVRMRTGPGRAAPPANLTATAQLQGQSARVDARLQAGSAQVAVNGEAPLGAGPVNLRATGGLDLALLDPILTVNGRRARGRLTLDGAVAGTAAAPRVTGSARLAGGEVQDFTQGLRISDIAAQVVAEGDTVRIASFTGRAGPGTISASGRVGLAAPMPVDLQIRASNARPIASDTLQAELDANLTVRGQAQGDMNLGGNVLIRNAEIRIPSRLPASVVTLKVIRPGQAPDAKPPPGPAPSMNLDLTVSAPQQIFVRGRGVDAELSGDLRIRGSASKPQVSGGFEMRRGQLSLAGTTLDFTRGKVGFNGTGPGGKIDPTLDFVAQSTSNSVTATLNIGGYASAPKITLTSVPDLPQDEILSYLLFRRSLKDVGPFGIASIAASLAELTGVGGDGGLNPLGAIRSGLGLDRLSVGGGSGTGTGTSVEAGRYVANGVYLGAKQSTGTDSGTGATLQIDITKGLKLETDVGSGRGGNQVGVTYEFEY